MCGLVRDGRISSLFSRYSNNGIKGGEGLAACNGSALYFIFHWNTAKLRHCGLPTPMVERKLQRSQEASQGNPRESDGIGRQREDIQKRLENPLEVSILLEEWVPVPMVGWADSHFLAHFATQIFWQRCWSCQTPVNAVWEAFSTVEIEFGCTYTFGFIFLYSK